MPKLIMMVGVAGSGKSTIAIRYALTQSAIIFSSDTIRGEIYGDENCQKNPGRVFDILHQRITKTLSEGFDVVYDATNLSCKRRMNFLKSIAHIDCRKECVVVVATPEDIEERMKLRDRKVPMEVVHKQLCQFQCPNYYEGWDKIKVVYNSTTEKCREFYEKIWHECDIYHDNPHHSLSVVGHMIAASDHAVDFAWREGINLIQSRWVARIHDIGKARTKTFTDRNGNPTDIAHYYGHQNYSAYVSLIFDATDWDITESARLDNACLIQWHMEHYLRKGSALERFYAMLGPELAKKLHILEQADKAAH